MPARFCGRKIQGVCHQIKLAEAAAAIPPFFTAKPRQHKDRHRVKGCERDLVIRDEIEGCYYEQRRRDLGDDQGSWLSSKILFEIHLNKSAWGRSVEQADLRRINKDAYVRSLSMARLFIAEVPKTVSRLF